MSDREPGIIINGVKLSQGQALTLLVAISYFDPDCGEDAMGREMTKLYNDWKREIFALMVNK